jgi:hypothetical protein
VSTWDIDYHRKRLEEASGHAWAPSADDISGASANVKASRNVRAAVVGATRMLRSTTFVALGCVLVGIAQGVIGLGLFVFGVRSMDPGQRPESRRAHSGRG